MEYFVSKNHNTLNKRVFAPETITNRLCLNPKYGVYLQSPPAQMNILLDSGAFQDRERSQRLSFNDALDRQLRYEQHLGFVSKYIVSYDRIVDESPIVQGKRRKRRVSRRTADRYVEETIDAAKFFADQRRDLKPRRLVLSNQGVNPDQYVDCVKETLSFSHPSDVIGMGGFCIIGQVPKYTEDYFETLERTLPLLRKSGVKRLHLFGVGVFKVLIKTHVMCQKYGIIPSYDTSSPEFNAVFGKVFSPDIDFEGPEGVHLRKVFDKGDKYRLYHPRDWAMLNIQMVNIFWDKLNELYPLPEERK
jgi:queuine/archaeosine tRNA-ribosyltransferase